MKLNIEDGTTTEVSYYHNYWSVSVHREETLSASSAVLAQHLLLYIIQISYGNATFGFDRVLHFLTVSIEKK